MPVAREKIVHELAETGVAMATACLRGERDGGQPCGLVALTHPLVSIGKEEDGHVCDPGVKWRCGEGKSVPA